MAALFAPQTRIYKLLELFPRADGVGIRRLGCAHRVGVEDIRHQLAQRLVGHSLSESVDLIRILQAYVTRPENIVRWHWQEGDVAIWDNRATQHYAIADYGSERRKMQRVTTAGIPVEGLDGRTSQALQGDASRYYLES